MCNDRSNEISSSHTHAHDRLVSSSSRVSRFNAWFFDVVDRYANHVAHIHKRNAFEGISSGTVVELGAGTGANFRYLPADCHLIAVEPSVAMHARLQRNAMEQGVSLELLSSGGEQIALPDESVDEVIATLVLCTVAQPDQVLSEVIRILRPGGRFRFVEHIAAQPASPRRWVQQVVARPWAWIFEGCHTHRDTASTIENAGFANLTLEHRRFRRSLFFPINAAIWGVATKAAPKEFTGRAAAT